MKKVVIYSAAIAVLGLSGIVQANITIETVAIGDAGNAADTRTGSAYGSVTYNYNIGKYEVTAGQYCAFLNAKANICDTYRLYSASMWSGSYGCKIKQTSISGGGYSYTVAADYANKPVNYVSFWDACRFTNWLGNGQGDSSTETGAYTLNGYTELINENIQRNAGATWAVTSEDEWYKAAYYKGGGTYSLYANGTNVAPLAGTASNYYGEFSLLSPWDGTVNGALEQNGTKDMMGNVYEFNEAIIYRDLFSNRGIRGGCFANSNVGPSSSLSVPPTFETYNIGFRVSQVVPEPSSIIALIGGLAGLTGLRRRKA